jgi:hypothetical protein
MSDKLNIINEMRQFDRKNRGFYDELTDEERKKFSNYLMIRWGSAVEGSRELQEFYVIATNERLNRHFFSVGRHPKLQWLMATSVSPGMGTHRHPWIALKKKEAGVGSIRRQLAEYYPHLKDDELDLLASMTSTADLKALICSHGNDDKKV